MSDNAEAANVYPTLDEQQPAAPQPANSNNDGNNYGIGQFLDMPPGWSPSSGMKWTEWDRKVEMWEQLTSLPLSKRGIALAMVLSGEARKLADKIPLTTLQLPGELEADPNETLFVAPNLPPIKRTEAGIAYLRRQISNRFGIEEQDKAILVLLRLFSTRRRRGEDMHQRISRLDLALSEAGEHGFTMSVLGHNFLMMHWGGMSKQDIVNVLAPVRGKLPTSIEEAEVLRSHLRRQESFVHSRGNAHDAYHSDSRGRSSSRSSRSSHRSHSRGSSRSSSRRSSTLSRSSRSSRSSIHLSEEDDKQEEEPTEEENENLTLAKDFKKLKKKYKKLKQGKTSESHYGRKRSYSRGRKRSSGYKSGGFRRKRYSRSRSSSRRSSGSRGSRRSTRSRRSHRSHHSRHHNRSPSPHETHYKSRKRSSSRHTHTLINQGITNLKETRTEKEKMAKQ